MSNRYGDNTFKTNIYDEIMSQAGLKDLTMIEVAGELSEILQDICRQAYFTDEDIKRIKAEAKEEARQELLGKLAKN